MGSLSALMKGGRSRGALLLGFMVVTGGFVVPGAAARDSQAPHLRESANRLYGYTVEHSQMESRHEDSAIRAMDAGNIDSHLKYLSAYPGASATPGIVRRRKYIARKLRDAGWTVKLRTFYPYLADPQKVRVQLDMVKPYAKSLATKEKRYPWYKGFDETSVGFSEGTPPADLTRPIVYVNFGRAGDYNYLASQHIDVRGKIVLARYGAGQRSEKAYQAFIHGAAGLIIYSDPQQSAKGPVYPKGPWGAPDTIQHGTVYRWTQYLGDPLTPGYAATKDAPRIPVSKSNISKIPPTIPIGYGAAEPLLKNLGGPVAPKSWQGGLPFTYHIGPGSTSVHMRIRVEYKPRPITNVVAVIEGSEFPEKTVILDAHYDTWNYGASDNLSGTSVALEVARVLGELRKNGWKPRRSIIIVFTDGEERGISGSAEWAAWRGEKKMSNVVAEINSDGAAGRHFSMSGVPALDKVMRSVTKRVPWPGTEGSAYDDWSRGRKRVMSVPSGGADFMTYRGRYGVPVMKVGAYSSGDRYHCICDDYRSIEKFKDPGMKHGVAVGGVEAAMLMRFADADILPFHYDAHARAIGRYLEYFEGAERSELGGYTWIQTRPDIKLANQWAATAKRLALKRRQLLESNANDYADVNRAIMQLGRAMLVPDDGGLPGRKWYRNQIYAPQFHNGFALQLLPGLYDSLVEFHDKALTRRYAGYLHESLQKAVKITNGALEPAP